MESTEYLTTSLSTTSLSLILLPALLVTIFVFIFAGKRRRDLQRIRSCPHCRAAIDDHATDCGACHRKISFG